MLRRCTTTTTTYSIQRKVPQLRPIRHLVVAHASCSFNIGPAVISSIAAFTSTYPLDTLKTRTQNETSTVAVPKSAHKALFQGYAAGVVLCVFSSLAYFSILFALSTCMYVAQASAAASFLSSFVKVPGKAITKLLQNGDFTSAHDAAQYIHDNYGIGGFFRGFWPYVLDDIPEMAIKVCLFKYLEAWFGLNTGLIGALSGVISSIVTQPLDLLQTRMMCNISKKPIDYTNLPYFSGLPLVLVINAVQSSVFLVTYKTINTLMLL
jgi:hypothetical protein